MENRLRSVKEQRRANQRSGGPKLTDELQSLSHLGFLLVECVGTQHLSHSFKRRCQRQHELFKLVLIFSCSHRHTPKITFINLPAGTPLTHRNICSLTKVNHEEAAQRCVEGGPTPHIAQVGLVVHPQEREMLALSKQTNIIILIMWHSL